MKRESRLHRPLSDAIAVELTAKALRADLEGGALKREKSPPTWQVGCYTDTRYA